MFLAFQLSEIEKGNSSFSFLPPYVPSSFPTSPQTHKEPRRNKERWREWFPGQGKYINKDMSLTLASLPLGQAYPLPTAPPPSQETLVESPVFININFLFEPLRFWQFCNMASNNPSIWEIKTKKVDSWGQRRNNNLYMGFFFFFLQIIEHFHKYYSPHIHLS